MNSIRRRLCCFVLGLSCALPLASAPLFPDLSTDHWAQDAVASLAARGLVEGYPDGTFKGDRSASRWETALLVARLLAKMETAHATFGSKAEFDKVRSLAVALREELAALGVRVDALENQVDQLDGRVTELERISFYGSVESRVAFHSFRNTGAHFSDPTDALFNYDAIVGTGVGTSGVIESGPAAGLNLNPFTMGPFTVTNLDKGTPLFNGTGFTSLATLGLNIKVTPEVAARAEFRAFSSQGNALTSLYYGTSAPFLANAFNSTGTVSGGLAGAQPSNNQPFTRMFLDHFWVHHEPSNIRVRLGSLSDLKFDQLVYQKQFNPGAFAPAFLDSYGFQVTGQQDVGEGQYISWEVLGTLLPDRNIGVNGAAYKNQAWGGNIAYSFQRDRGQVKANFLRATNDASGGLARQVGLNGSLAQSATPWVNPNGFYLNQLGGFGQNTDGIAGMGDVRPIVMPLLGNDGVTGVPGQLNFGNIGPQAQDSYGLSARYNWQHKYQPYLKAEYARSDYQPNQNAGYSVSGDAFRLSTGAAFLDDALSVDLEYVAVDPTYDPFVLTIPPTGGLLFNGYRFGENFFTMTGDRYSLHDTSVFPHNREGFRAKLRWDFASEGTVGLRMGLLEQRKTSLQDVRFSQDSLGPAIPNTPVLGFSPGFTEPVFGGLSPFTFASDGQNTLARALENPKGSSDFLALDAKYRWTLSESDEDSEEFWSKGLTLRGGYQFTNFERPSSLSQLLPGPNGIAGENVNNVDLTYSSWGIGVDYDLTPTFTLNASYNEFRLSGHYDPFGIYSGYAVAQGTTDFDNFDLTQSQPTLGFEYALTESVDWNLATIFLSTKDGVSSQVFSTPVDPSNNRVFNPQRSVHPFSYEGIMVNSQFRWSF